VLGFVLLEVPLSALLLVLLAGCGYFAASETALASVSSVRIRTLAEQGNKRAKSALFLLNNFDRTLSTLLIGNNVLSIGVASITTLFAARFSGNWAVVVSTLLTTAVVFLFAETLPKSFAADQPETVALAVAPSLRIVAKALAPVSFVFNNIGKHLDKLIGGGKTPTVTEDELYELIENAADCGTLEKEQATLVRQALSFNEKTAAAVLTPAARINGVDADASADKVAEVARTCEFSRLPVFRGSVDVVSGVLQTRAFLDEYLKQGSQTDWKRLVSRPFYVSPAKAINVLFREMTKRQQHIAFVKDKHWHTLGIVTMEDILEELE
jgi:CBS domain containing-hemolysin-like protein